jgi:hypothetical protein
MKLILQAVGLATEKKGACCKLAEFKNLCDKC